jgi:phosphatidate cytidylyltransferase
MTRVASGAVLLSIAVAVVWFAPLLLFLAVAQLVLVLACVEYVHLARASGIEVPPLPATLGAALTSVGITSTRWMPASETLDLALITVFTAMAVVTLARWRGEEDALTQVAAGILPALYVGVPVGAMTVIHSYGRERLFLMMLTVFASDTAQYYTGRLLGRTPLAPRVSPKKTIEGAAGGFVAGILVMTVAGAAWLPAIGAPLRALLGAAIVALGIAGDLFESMLKRSAGLKDSSALIPGHGGILDRIDALLFVAPVYYVIAG